MPPPCCTPQLIAPAKVGFEALEEVFDALPLREQFATLMSEDISH